MVKQKIDCVRSISRAKLAIDCSFKLGHFYPKLIRYCKFSSMLLNFQFFNFGFVLFHTVLKFPLFLSDHASLFWASLSSWVYVQKLNFGEAFLCNTVEKCSICHWISARRINNYYVLNSNPAPQYLFPSIEEVHEQLASISQSISNTSNGASGSSSSSGASSIFSSCKYYLNTFFTCYLLSGGHNVSTLRGHISGTKRIQERIV